MVYATIPKEDIKNLSADRLTALSLYSTEVGYPQKPSEEEVGYLFDQLAQSRKNFFEYLCRYVRRELFEEVKRIIANPDEEFSLAGLDIKSENEKQEAVVSLYNKMSALERNLIQNRAENRTEKKRRTRSIEDYCERKENIRKEDRIYSKMAEYLEQLHMVNSYYERIVANYKQYRIAKNNDKAKDYVKGRRDQKVAEVNTLLNNYISSWNNIINRYLGYVIYFAKKCDGKSSGNKRKLELADLIQEGNIGLMKAVETFDRSLDVKFSGYAGLRISGDIKRAIDEKSRLIKTPAPFNKLCRDYEKAKKECSQELEREPTREEIYKKLGIDDEHISFLEARRNLANVLELDKQVRNNNKRTIAETVPNNEQSPLDKLEENELHDEVDCALEQLNEREIYVLSSHFGLDREPMIAKDIGNELGVSRITVQNVQKKALEKMKLHLVKSN